MIAIVIVNWNGGKDTVECLESLMRMEDGGFIAIVVDNGSGDGSMALLEDWASSTAFEPAGAPWPLLPGQRVRQPMLLRQDPHGEFAPAPAGSTIIVETGKNLGFAGANNVGMRLARQDSRITHFWLLNNDTVVAPDCLSRLRETAARKPWAAILGNTLIYYHTPEVVQGVAGVFWPRRAVGDQLGFRRAPTDLPSEAELESEMSYALGASMFLAVGTYDEIGPMAEDYFLYFEELDWAERLGGPGRQSVALEAIVYHKEGGSIGTSSVARPSDTALYYLNTNLLRYMWRWHPLLMPVAIARIARRMLGHARSGDFQGVKVLSIAMLDRVLGRSRQGRITL